MNRWVATVLLILTIITGCGIHVVPQPANGFSINQVDNSITATQNNITVSARVQDLEVGPYTGQNNITTFYIVIENGGKSDIYFSRDSFLLLDENGKQYRPLDPDKVKSTIKAEADFLIPYPYVGYYYLQDKVQFDYNAQFASSLPYTGHDPTLDVDAEALPIESVIPGAKIAGMIYFNIDLYQKKRIDLKIRFPAVDGSVGPELSFPFVIEK